MSAKTAGKITWAERMWHGSRVLSIIVIIVVGLLVIGRLALPSVVRDRMNKSLDSIPDYHGHVERVGIHLWRGAYSLHHLVFTKRDGQVEQPFVAVESIDFSIAWRELWHRHLVADISLVQPVINFVEGPSAESSQVKADKRWQDVIKGIFPIDITFIKITRGKIRFANTASTPKVDVSLDNLEALATGLQNRTSVTSGEFPAQIDLAADTIGGGKIRINTALEPLALQPHFLLKFQLEEVSLPALNDFLKAYSGIDVSAGVFKAYTEMQAKDGHFAGYFKPFFQHVDFKPLPGEKRTIGQEVKVFGARLFAYIFKNSQHDQVATRIPFSGEFSKVNVKIWPTIVALVRNGFIQALPEKLDNANTDKPVTGDHPATNPKK